MALTKVTGKGITCSAVTEDKLGTSAVTTNKIGPNAVTAAKIQDGQVNDSDLASTLDLSSKTVTLPCGSVTASNLASTLDLSSKTITLPGSATNNIDTNIALLGFKMAVNDGLTVFNLVDGVVDEFNDESGTDEAEGSNDTYNCSSDFYVNSTSPTGVAFNTPACFSAGFSTLNITEPDTSTAGTNPAPGSGTAGEFTVPCGMTSASVYVWGAGGGSGYGSCNFKNSGGGGGFSSATLATSPGQVFDVLAGEGGLTENSIGGGPRNCAARPLTSGGLYGGGETSAGGGGGLAGIFVSGFDWCAAESSPGEAPDAYIIAGSGGGGGYVGPAGSANSGRGGGTSGGSGGFGGYGPMVTGGGGGTQCAGGSGGSGPLFGGSSGNLFKGGPSPRGGAGGSGYYGGGGGGGRPDGGGQDGNGGGGSGYVGHPQLSSTSTCGGGQGQSAPGAPSPFYSTYYPISDPANSKNTSTGGNGTIDNDPPTGGDKTGVGGDGYVLITGTGCTPTPASVTSTTIVSEPFTSTSVATSARIVVFEENVDTPTLNTDIIASVSRDGTNFTNATLSDSGYVTGSSGQRILTGQADISGQPSGQSMRWKLALANNTVKIHGVALQWS